MSWNVVVIGYTPETIEREFAPMLAIRDHYPKYVITMEEHWHDNIDGVLHKNLADFLLQPA